MVVLEGLVVGNGKVRSNSLALILITDVVDRFSEPVSIVLIVSKSTEYESVIDGSCGSRLFEKILGEALEDAAGLVDTEFFGGVEATLDRHFHRFAVLAMNHQRQGGAR